MATDLTNTHMSLEQALDACIEYSSGNSCWTSGAFVQKTRANHSTYLPLREQHDMLLMAEPFLKQRLKNLAVAHKVEGLTNALRDGKIIAWGYAHPHKPRDKKIRLEPSQWRYLTLDPQTGIAAGSTQEYSTLEFRAVPDITNTETSAKRGRPSRRADILNLFEKHQSEFEGCTQPMIANKLQKRAFEQFGTDKNFSTSSITQTLRDEGKFKLLKNKE